MRLLSTDPICIGVVVLCLISSIGAVSLNQEALQLEHRHQNRHLKWVSLENAEEQDLSKVHVDDDCLRPIDTPLPVDRPIAVGYNSAPLLLSDDSPYIGYLDVLASLSKPHPEHVCAAHRAGVRILSPPLYIDRVHNFRHLMMDWQNTTALSEHQAILEAYVKETGVDGFSHDIEDAFERGSPMYRGYVELVRVSNQAMKNAAPQGMVLVATAWSPDAIDARLYDYAGLGQHAYLFVMAYDMASQMWTRCIASPNAPFYAVQKGLNRYLDLGVPPHRLILGTGWYGRSYQCNNPKEEGLGIKYCSYTEYPWREAVCTDLHASEMGFGGTNAIVRGQAGYLVGEPQWDSTAGQHFINYATTANRTSPEVVVRQLWYADVRSLELQYSMAVSKLKIGGIGMWTPNSLAWKTELDIASSREMLEALARYAGPQRAPWVLDAV